MEYISLIGFLAGLFTTLAFIPQVYKVIKTKQTTDISLMMYIIFTLGVCFWEVYGILIGEIPIIIANSITAFLAGIVLFYKIRYK